MFRNLNSWLRLFCYNYYDFSLQLSTLEILFVHHVNSFFVFRLAQFGVAGHPGVIALCGGGRRIQTRTCNNALIGVRNCEGDNQTKEACAHEVCYYDINAMLSYLDDVVVVITSPLPRDAGTAQTAIQVMQST